jgi:uncharacterized protein
MTTSLKDQDQSTKKQSLNLYFRAIAHYVLAHSKVTLLVVCLCTLLAISLIINHVKIDNNLEVFAPVNSKILKSRDQYQKMFGRDDLFMISVKGDVFTGDFLGKIKKLEQDIQNLDLDIKSLGMSRNDWRLKNDPKHQTSTDNKLKIIDKINITSIRSTSVSKSSPNEDIPTLNDSWEDFGEEDTTNGDGWGDEKGGSIIEETTSLVSVKRTYQENNSLKVEPWFDPIPSQSEINRLKPLMLQDELVAQRLIDREGKLSVILVRAAIMLDDDLAKVYEAIREIVNTYQSPTFQIRVTGPPAVNAALNELVLRDLSQLLLLSGIAMFFALIYLFRRPLMIIGPIVVVMISVIWTIGFMAYFDMGLNMLSSILPAFLLCVGMGDSIHLQSIYKSKCKMGFTSYQAIIESCTLTGPPVLFTSLTTMIGLLSFQFATVTAVKEMGLAGGIGVCFALLHSLITLPIFLKWQKDLNTLPMTSSNHEVLSSVTNQLHNPPRQHDPDRIDQALGFLVNISREKKARTRLLSLSIIFIGLAFWGVARLEVWHDDLETLPPNHPIRVGIYEVDHALGGVASAQYIIHDNDPLGVKRIETLQAILKLSQHAFTYQDLDQDLPLVGHALSLVNIVKETHQALMPESKISNSTVLAKKSIQAKTKVKKTPQVGSTQILSNQVLSNQDPSNQDPSNQVLNNQDPSSQVPSYLQSQTQASQLLSLFELQSPEDLRRMATIDLKDSHLTLQVKWREATSYEEFITWMDEGIKRYIPPGITIQPTGGIYLAFNIVSSLLSDLLRSFAGAFLIITLLMVLMLKSWKLGLLAMIPNLTPIIIMLGALGHAGIPLDLNNLLIASIALGIAVDDTIHLLHHFQMSYHTSGDCEQAIQSSLLHAGRAMLSTTVLLFTGFIVYLAASTVAIQRFGVVIACTILMALVIDLLLCPAILRIAYGKLNEA